MIAILKKFWMEEEGGETVEWPLVIALIALVAIASWALVGTEVKSILDLIVAELQKAG